MEVLQAWVQEKVVVDGLINVFKPYGIPSTALTEMYKKATGLKVGHGGTLDPMAQGMMLLGIGKGTKLLTKYLESEKRYRAGILLGVTSDSGDLELPVRVPDSQTLFSEERVVEIFKELSHPYTQVLPTLNAAKHKGKTAYQLVREGKEVEQRVVETRLLDWVILHQMEIRAPELAASLAATEKRLIASFESFYAVGKEIGYPAQKYSFMLEKWRKSLEASRLEVEKVPRQRYLFLDIEVLVPKGTYIRALATDIASRIGTVGMLILLERLSAGNY